MGAAIRSSRGSVAFEVPSDDSSDESSESSDDFLSEFSSSELSSLVPDVVISDIGMFSFSLLGKIMSGGDSTFFGVGSRENGSSSNLNRFGSELLAAWSCGGVRGDSLSLK